MIASKGKRARVDQPVAHPRTPDGRYFIVRGRLWRLSNPNLSGLVGLPAAFSARDNGQSHKAAPDLVSDLWILFAACFDPVVIERTAPVYPLARGNASVTP